MASNCTKDVLQQNKDRLAEYIKAEQTILRGGESYTIGNRTLTRADLKYVQEQIDKLTISNCKLSRGNRIRVRRVVPRDL